MAGSRAGVHLVGDQHTLGRDMKRRTGARLAVVAAAITPIAVLAMRRRHQSAIPTRTPGADSRGRPRIVVLGAGFAGIETINALADSMPAGAADVLLVDQNNYHLFTPLLYQVATGAVDPRNIAYPLRPFCRRRGFDFLTAHVQSVNLVERYVETDAGRLRYDYLVLGLGSQTNFFGMREVEQRSLGLKSLAGASHVRRSVINCVEQSSRIDSAAERRRLLTFAVVGAGPTGVELVASLHDLVHNNLLPYYPSLQPEDTRIVLIEAMDTVLPGLDEKMRRIAGERMGQLGIDLRLSTRVAGIENGAVVTRGGDPIPAATIVWTAGIRPNPVAAGLAVEKSRDGRIVVDEYLRVPSAPNVFALGDNAYTLHPRTGKPLPANASVAVREGTSAGHNLARLVAGEPIRPFVYRSPGELIALGRRRAAAQLGPVTFGGLPAWLLWRGFYLTELMGTRNRIGVAIDWIAALFSRRYIANTEA